MAHHFSVSSIQDFTDVSSITNNYIASHQVYPRPKGGAAHFFNPLPRLIMLLRAIPEDVPVMVPKHQVKRYATIEI